jgi:thymidine kinase
LGYARLEVIVGPMFCGKSEELIRRVKRAEIANLGVRIFYPQRDTRAPVSKIFSRNGLAADASQVERASQMLVQVDERTDVVAIDEAQLLEDGLVDVVNRLVDNGRRVIVAGLDLDFAGRPFGPMPALLSLADRVDKLTAVCMQCGSTFATRTQRLIDNRPAGKDSPLILIGDRECYEARCFDCYEPPS